VGGVEIYPKLAAVLGKPPLRGAAQLKVQLDRLASMLNARSGEESAATRWRRLCRYQEQQPECEK